MLTAQAFYGIYFLAIFGILLLWCKFGSNLAVEGDEFVFELLYFPFHAPDFGGNALRFGNIGFEFSSMFPILGDEVRNPFQIVIDMLFPCTD